MRLTVILAAVVLLITPVRAQQQAAPAGTLRFASASVEASELDGDFAVLSRDIRIGPGDQFEANATLRRLVEYAYGFDQRWDHARGSEPLLDQMFFVSARAAPGAFDADTLDDLSAVRHMLQHLLADRFNVTVAFNEETRTALVLRRASATAFGPRLQPVPGGCADGSQADADARGLARCLWSGIDKVKVVAKDFDQVAAWISRRARMDVVNETGLIGAFAFETVFDPSTINPNPPQLTIDTSRVDPALARVMAIQLNPQYPLDPPFATAMKSDLDLVVTYEPRPARVMLITHVEPLREN
ncbi:MAG TPA: TIGR03435 family protein [Vicinamibacterales bacterium]|jgi:uncharacterized protein (TIGR03435 family)|nr:TIGR03435 family protein [Vicinamibacterales bacterium]